MPAERKLYDLVVVGSSAGGIEALSLLVSTLPADFPGPIVLGQHLGPDRPSHLADILARQSALPVRIVNEEAPEPLVAGTIYVVPADRDVEITDRAVVLHARSTGLPKPSIDLLLASAAHVYGEHVLAVILTGTGSDGAAGALAVKAAGGTVIIENPDTASYPAMPASLAPSSVDMRVDLARIGPLLYDLLVGAPVLSAPEDMLLTLLAEARAYSGIDFSQYKRPTILRRLQSRMTSIGSLTLADYATHLQRHPEEYMRLSASFLIKVTEFFRDQELFDHLHGEIIPEIISWARKQGNRIRIWSAGCATGEEAYSLAMLIAEQLGDELDHFTVQIFATDADADAVAFARRGLYSTAALATIPEAFKARYFAPVDDGWAVSKRVRSLVIFGEHDLGQRAPFPHIDLVLCRNVLIYFTPELQKRALQLFAFSLHNGGYLALGTAETTAPLPDYFVAIQPHLKVFRRQGSRMLVPQLQTSAPQPAHFLARELSLLPTNTTPAHPAAHESRSASVAAKGALSRSAHAVLGEQILGLPLGVVVVDANYDVQTINETAYALLGIHRMAAGRDLLHLASRVPTKPLRAVIDAAFLAPDAPNAVSPVSLVTSVAVELVPGEPRTLQVTGYPNRQKAQRNEPTAAVDAVILLISDVTEAQPAAGVAEPQTPSEGERVQRPASQRRRHIGDEPTLAVGAKVERAQQRQREQALAQELAQALAALKDVKTANQELRDANQELRQDNDILQLREEDAQASAEEVKTLNEELQATNEELETLNEELEATLEELRATNDDLHARTVELEELAAQRDEERLMTEYERARLAAILASMSDALLVIDTAGKVSLTNGAYDKDFGSASPYGDPVPLYDANGRLLPPEATLQHRARQVTPFTMEFGLRAADGTQRWFEARGQSIRHDGGLSKQSHPEQVVTIRDISEGSMLRLQEQFVAIVNHELRNPLTSLQIVVHLLAKLVQSGGGQDQQQRLSSIALREMRQLNSMVDDLTDLARVQAKKLHLKREQVELSALIQNVVESLNTTQDVEAVNQRVIFRAVPDVPGNPDNAGNAGNATSLSISGDPRRLEQIIINLVSNARTHAQTKRPIDVTLHRREAWAELRVKDYGSGIAEADLVNLFAPYYQTGKGEPARAKGLGLGLFITSELVKAHDGTITVHSVLGQGTEFLVRLPLSTELVEMPAYMVSAEQERSSQDGSTTLGG